MLEIKVCKVCGKSGRFIRLSKDCLCNECESVRNNQMTQEELVDHLVAYVHNRGDLSMIQRNLADLEAQSSRAMKNHTKLFEKYETARALEREGKADAALELYRQILPYCPQGTDYYIRPCIILERMKQYDEAVEICKQAIRMIHEGRMQADVTEFQKRMNRLLSKMQK